MYRDSRDSQGPAGKDAGRTWLDEKRRRAAQQVMLAAVALEMYARDAQQVRGNFQRALPSALAGIRGSAVNGSQVACTWSDAAGAVVAELPGAPALEAGQGHRYLGPRSVDSRRTSHPVRSTGTSTYRPERSAAQRSKEPARYSKRSTASPAWFAAAAPSAPFQLRLPPQPPFVRWRASQTPSRQRQILDSRSRPPTLLFSSLHFLPFLATSAALPPFPLALAQDPASAAFGAASLSLSLSFALSFAFFSSFAVAFRPSPFVFFPAPAAIPSLPPACGRPLIRRRSCFTSTFWCHSLQLPFSTRLDLDPRTPHCPARRRPSAAVSVLRFSSSPSTFLLLPCRVLARSNPPQTPSAAPQLLASVL
ncbi:hypothetical protein CCMA1212_002910 [Trichoderma ghanense]|uniref:Uncharacterized protein n=1 Tax=Trichoderma ghanense TaxID=65468 RepID=A0ABY2HA37_9HYPO